MSTAPNPADTVPSELMGQNDAAPGEQASTEQLQTIGESKMKQLASRDHRSTSSPAASNAPHKRKVEEIDAPGEQATGEPQDDAVPEAKRIKREDSATAPAPALSKKSVSHAMVSSLLSIVNTDESTETKPASKRKGAGKPKPKKQPATELGAPKPKRTTKAVRAKITSVLAHLQDRPDNIIPRSDKDPSHAVLPESALMGALQAFHADWQISEDPLRASLRDVSECIVNYYEGCMGTLQTLVKFYTIDLGERSSVEEAVHQKIAGHGLEGQGLLEIEIEMYLRELEKAMAMRLFEAVEEEESDEEEENGAGTRRFGVCPQLPKDL